MPTHGEVRLVCRLHVIVDHGAGHVALWPVIVILSLLTTSALLGYSSSAAPPWLGLGQRRPVQDRSEPRIARDLA